MYVDLSDEQRALQTELRDYFGKLVGAEVLEEIRGSEGGGPLYRKTLETMGRDGWLGIGWPREYGGQGRTPIEQFVFADEVQRAGFPLPFLTLGTVGPTLMRFGTEEQKRRFLRPLFTGEEVWCQLFSEPGAGSDVAGLATRAMRDGDEWVINGQKVWTTVAHLAHWGMIVARTDPEAPKHRGLTYFLMDMHAAGVEVRPLRQITGEAEFNEVYLTEIGRAHV